MSSRSPAEILAPFRTCPDTSNLPRDVVLALTTIHDRLFEPSLSVGSVLEVCGIRSHTFRTRFRQHVGVTLKAYVEQQRVRAARRLIDETDLNLADVSICVGYGNYRTFGRAFRRRIGQAPSRHA